MERQLFPDDNLRVKLRMCGGQGQAHLENMLELIGEWLETAQINQLESNLSSEESEAQFSRSSLKVPENVENSDDEENFEVPENVECNDEEEDFEVPENVENSDDDDEDLVVDSQANNVVGNPHGSFEYISQQVRRVNLIYAHLMLNLEAYVDLGHITLAKMATVLKEWDNESIEEALDEDIQEDLVSFTQN